MGTHRHTYLWVMGALLVGAAALLHWVHYLIFHDAHHVFIYMVGDVAFVPLEVLLVVIVLERLLHSHEKHAMMEKLNIVIGAFFSEVGTRLLGELTPAVADVEEVRQRLAVDPRWTPEEFAAARRYAAEATPTLDPTRLDLEGLRSLLMEERDFLLRLLENPNLLEHETFTDLLWAVVHLGEELQARPSLEGLPANDLRHLSGDLGRAYGALAREWVAYAQHLKTEYPFLFSLLVRTHPLQDHPEAMVR
ncbi:MAG: hypothetical protein JXA57_12055 [Armatimonadetes bacterium]|nr:hypothetical protein [Armatimonadota bacterium]